jgi:hypothetical protein
MNGENVRKLPNDRDLNGLDFIGNIEISVATVFEFPALFIIWLHLFVFTLNFEALLQLYSHPILNLFSDCIHVGFRNFPAVVFT